MGLRRRGPVVIVRRALRLYERLDETQVMPGPLAFTRAAGNNSYQTGPAVNGTTFIAMNAGVDVPRYHYVPSAQRRMLLVEPARQNYLPDSAFVDAAPHDGLPDGWLNGGGVPSVDYDTIHAGAPHGGAYLTLADTATANRGVYCAIVLAALTTYTSSGWFRRTGAGGAANVYGHHTLPGVSQYSIGVGPYDWSVWSGTAATVGLGIWGYSLEAVGDPSGVVHAVCPQTEDGTTRSTWVPTIGVAATRAVERLLVDPAIMPAGGGDVSFLWSPGYADTEAYGTPVLFDWNATTYIELTAAKTIRIVNAGVARATSAALTWAAWSVHLIRLQYGSYGTRIWVDGVAVTDTNAWVTPLLASPSVGGVGAAGNIYATHAFGDLRIAA